MRILLTILISFICQFSFATNYYFSLAGSDSNPGTLAAPWKTITKFNSIIITKQPGDSILFNRGDVFYGQLIITRSGSIANPIVISAYGSGADPVITGLSTITAWTNLGSNIWESTSAVSTLATLNMVLINGVVCKMGRYPNSGYLNYTSHSGNTSITGTPIGAIPFSAVGAEVVIRKFRWVLDRHPVTVHSSNTLTYTSGTFSFNGNNNTYSPVDGNGFFIQKHASTLDAQNEWYYNPSNKKLRIYSTSSPTGVQVSTIENNISAGTKSYVTITGLKFTGGNSNGAYLIDCNSFFISDCAFENQGWNGIYGGTLNNLTIARCTIDQCLNNGIYLEYGANNSLVDVVDISNTGLIAGAGKSGDGNQEGILIVGNNTVVRNCTVTNSGYNGIAWNGNKALVENNFVDSFCIVKDDGGGIYTYVSDSGTVRNNVVLHAIGAKAGAESSASYEDFGKAAAIYLDNGSVNHNAIVDNNTVAHGEWGGILVNNNGGNTVTNNIVFDFKFSMHIIESNAGDVRNLTIKNNQFIAYSSTQKALYNQMSVVESPSLFGTLDSNVYARPIDDDDVIQTTTNGSLLTHRTLAQWKTYSGQDANSSSSAATVAGVGDIDFQYRASTGELYDFTGLSKIDPAGTIYNNAAVIPGQGSIILLANGSSNATSSTILSGSASYDPDGTISTYAWSQVTGPNTATIASASAATTGVSNLIIGTYQFQLTVTDNSGGIGRDTVEVEVKAPGNTAPTANAGTDSTITLPANTSTLIGSGTDADGTIANYFWTKSLSSPSGGIITHPDSSTTGLTGLNQGIYFYQLRVTDNNGLTDYDTVKVTVNANPTPPGSDGEYTFTLDTISHVSIGVYQQDSILVKTIISDEIYAAGSHTLYWDGTDDAGYLITNPDSIYTIKVQSNNVVYDWQGTLGNTSDSMVGVRKHRGYYDGMRSLAFGSTYGYFCTGYNEGGPSIGKFAIATPQQKLFTFISPGVRTPLVDFVATDGTIVYWASVDASQINNTFVFGTRVSNDTEVLFDSGRSTPVTNIRTFQSGIAKLNQAGSLITGLAVQRTGNFLFVSRSRLDQIQVLHKTTGALVQTLTLTTPKAMCVDGSDNLWVITGTNVSKYTVNVDGTLSAATLTLSGLSNPMAVQVSTNGTLVAVADAGTSEQVKFFNNTTGVATNTLGTAGGYDSDPTVTNNKFYFKDARDIPATIPILQTFIAYQPDGTFWVNDPGNSRVLHYDASRNFVDRIMWLGATYNTWVDKNNITRVFSDNMEFEMDYSVQDLTGTTGWTLKRNWGANVTSSYNGFPRFQTTLSNGRTYGIIWNKSVPNQNLYEVVEYPPSGPLRFTGVITNNTNKILADDGSRQTYTTSGLTATIKRLPLTGFDVNNNPIWSTTGEVLATAITNNVVGNPVVPPVTQIFSTTNKVTLFNYKAEANANGPTWHKGYHLGIMSKGADNVYLAQTEKSTHRNYQGAYPKAGWFEEGNGVRDFAGGNVNITDRNIITSYHGEFWKNTQTNEFNHYYDNGLAIGQFGTTRVDVSGHAAAEMAGNATSAAVVKDANGDLYLYHGDESDHSGIHRWKISGLNTIREQNFSVYFPSSYSPQTPDYTLDLMSGLERDKTLPNNQNGWTRSPTVDNYLGTDYFRVWTSLQSYDTLRENDVQAEAYVPTAGTKTVSRDLGVNNVASDWAITGLISFPAGSNPNTTVSKQFLDVLDASGKILATFYMNDIGNGISNIYGNTALITPVYHFSSAVKTPTAFRIAVVSGSFTFTYGDYTPVTTTISDVTGNWHTPTTLRIRFLNTGLAGGKYTSKVSLKNLKFYKDVL